VLQVYRFAIQGADQTGNLGLSRSCAHAIGQNNALNHDVYRPDFACGSIGAGCSKLAWMRLLTNPLSIPNMPAEAMFGILCYSVLPGSLVTNRKFTLSPIGADPCSRSRDPTGP
jgi:hypothetical protein